VQSVRIRSLKKTGKRNRGLVETTSLSVEVRGGQECSEKRRVLAQENRGGGGRAKEGFKVCELKERSNRGR